MAHFAQIDESNIVTQVVVVHNSDAPSEAEGIQFLQAHYPNTTWKQTSYNKRIRKNYAGIGYTYDLGRDAFIPPQPYPSWTVNEDTCLWSAPISEPIDDNRYRWDESTTSWVMVST